LRRGAPLEDAPVPPVEADNDESPVKAKKGRPFEPTVVEATAKG
jgi:hypothetical protein